MGKIVGGYNQITANIADSFAFVGTDTTDTTMDASGTTKELVVGNLFQDVASARALDLKGGSGITHLIAAIANRNNARCDIPVIGDSVTEGQGTTGTAAFTNDRWIANANRAIRNRYPTRATGSAGGIGFIPIQTTSGSAPSFTWPVTLASGTPSQAAYGPCRGNYTVTAAASWTFVAPAGTTSVKIMYYDQFSPAGSFSYKVNAGASTTVTLANTSNDLLTASITMTGGDTLTIQWVSGTVFIDGIMHFAGDESSGVTFHGCGHQGWQATTGAAGWNQSSIFNWEQVYVNAFPNTCAIGIMLGINDAATGNGNETGPTFQTNLGTLVSTLRTPTALANIPIFFIIPYNPNVTYADSGGWPAYAAAIRGAAAAISNAHVIDLNYRLPSVASNFQGGELYFDAVHPNRMGHATVGEIVASGFSVL